MAGIESFYNHKSRHKKASNRHLIFVKQHWVLASHPAVVSRPGVVSIAVLPTHLHLRDLWGQSNAASPCGFQACLRCVFHKVQWDLAEARLRPPIGRCNVVVDTFGIHTHAPTLTAYFTYAP